MPKHEALTPKAIGNRIKSIGLQKLRWYCQMCQKQCRDENGFKCHTTSESHLRQMRLFAENPDEQIDEFSAEFERGFIEMLSYRHGTKRVQANRVYQEYIGDKHHIHMNATIWTSLTEICKYLGKEGKATVDETEKGWFIQYIDKDPRLLAKQAAMDQRKVVEYDEEERTRRVIESQIAAAAAHEQRRRADNGDDDAADEEDVGVQDLTREEGADKIEMSMAAKKGPLKRPLKLVSFGGESADQRNNEEGGNGDPSSKRVTSFSSSSSSLSSSQSHSSSAQSAPSTYTSSSSSAPAPSSSRAAPKSAMEQIMYEEEKKKQAIKENQEKKERTDYWLQPGIVVKITNKKLADGKYFKKKGVVISVIDKYVGEISVLDMSAVLKLDQEDLETVVPKVGSSVMILNGYGRGQTATLMRINEKDFNCDVRIESRRDKEEVLTVVYEDMSRIYVDE